MFCNVNSVHNLVSPSRRSFGGHSDSTGSLFLGDAERVFVKERLNFTEDLFESVCYKYHSSCENWGVLTSIFLPNEAVRRFHYLENWCLVIVGDLQSPSEYRLISSRMRGDQFVYLSPEEQTKFLQKFSNILPWNSFGRKNIAYLYAIGRGAKRIWDFDDDNYLKFWINGAAGDQNMFLDSHLLNYDSNDNIAVSIIQCNGSKTFFNPYLYLGATIPNAWPRGYPISEVKSKLNFDCLPQSGTLKSSEIGILQSVADHQPDVDAVFRLTVKDTFYFNNSKVENKSKSSKYLVLPNGLYAPTNAQATLYFKHAFPTLYLPVTVTGRVSDIWRSYIGQAILSLYGIHTGYFWRAIVDQNRNEHSFEADFESEIDLYTKTKALVTVLDNWTRHKISQKDTKSKRTIQDAITDLYINLYERQFIEIEDVQNVQIWLQLFNRLCLKKDRAQHTHTYLTPTIQVNWYAGVPIIYDKEAIDTDICSELKPRVFWTSDLHDGCRIDIPTTLAKLGQQTILGGIKGKNTPYPEAFMNANINVYTGSLPKSVRSYITHSTAINEDMIIENVRFFNESSEFDKVDAVFCSFPASMCQLWFPFNKTKSILFLPSHRYNLGRCTVESWNLLNRQLEELANVAEHRKGLSHVIGAVSRYDLEYLNYYTGLSNTVLIPSFSGFYTETYKYKPILEEVLVVSQTMPDYLKTKTIAGQKIVHYRHKYPHYTLNDIASHPALIFIPYSVMSFKFTEFYSLCIPMFVPSAEFFLSNGGIGPDRTSTSYPYCPQDSLLSIKMPKNPRSYHSYNPNAEFADSAEDEMYWLQFSDFYDFPHIIYFNNVSDLEKKLQSTDFTQVHNVMKKENRIRKKTVIKKWCDILGK